MRRNVTQRRARESWQQKRLPPSTVRPVRRSVSLPFSSVHRKLLVTAASRIHRSAASSSSRRCPRSIAPRVRRVRRRQGQCPSPVPPCHTPRRIPRRRALVWRLHHVDPGARALFCANSSSSWWFDLFGGSVDVVKIAFEPIVWEFLA